MPFKSSGSANKFDSAVSMVVSGNYQIADELFKEIISDTLEANYRYASLNQLFELTGIFNQDYAVMPEGASFNIWIPSVDTAVFVHFARAVTITDNFTYIDHPLTNNNPDAIVFVTQNWNPSGVGNVYNDQPIGVWYSTLAKKWSIFNQDNTSSMPVDAAFNVLIASPSSNAFVHTATPANTVYNYTLIDSAFTNKNAGAIVFAAQNYNPAGGAGQYNDYPIGVWYSGGARKWSVFNQDNTSSMPVGADFNIIVFLKLYLPFIMR